MQNIIIAPMCFYYRAGEIISEANEVIQGSWKPYDLYADGQDET